MSPKVTLPRYSAQALHFPHSIYSLSRLSQAWRLLDDISPRQAELIAEHCGGDPARLLEVGYGVVSTAFLQQFETETGFIKKGSIVLACRDAAGEIIGLHDHRLKWLTPARVHIANPVRSAWAEIQICETTSQADSLALAENICAIGRNGCDKRDVVTAVLAARRSYSSYTIKQGERSHHWGVAA
jgi:hypothetical protein